MSPLSNSQASDAICSPTTNQASRGLSPVRLLALVISSPSSSLVPHRHHRPRASYPSTARCAQGGPAPGTPRPRTPAEQTGCRHPPVALGVSLQLRRNTAAALRDPRPRTRACAKTPADIDDLRLANTKSLPGSVARAADSNIEECTSRPTIISGVVSATDRRHDHAALGVGEGVYRYEANDASSDANLTNRNGDRLRTSTSIQTQVALIRSPNLAESNGFRLVLRTCFFRDTNSSKHTATERAVLFFVKWHL